MDFGKWELFIPPGPDGVKPVSHGSKLKVQVSQLYFCSMQSLSKVNIEFFLVFFDMPIYIL